MANQTHMNGHGVDRSVNGLGQGVTDLVGDVIELSELQVQLLLIDLRDASQRAAAPVGVALGGAILALGAVPVLLSGIAWVIVHSAGWSEGLAWSVTGACALVIAGTMLWWGWRTAKASVQTLTRSRTELFENLCWIRNALARRPASR